MDAATLKNALIFWQTDSRQAVVRVAARWCETSFRLLTLAIYAWSKVWQRLNPTQALWKPAESLLGASCGLHKFWI